MIQLWRGLNSSLGFGAVILVFVIGVKPKFRRANEEMRLMMIVTLLALFVLTVGSIEQALQQGAFGYRVPLTSMVFIIAWAAMLRGLRK